MTWVAQSNPGMMAGLLNFLKSPMAQGMSQGLLAASAPRLGPRRGFGEAMGMGFQRGTELTDLDRKRKIEEGSLAETGRHNKATEAINQLAQQLAKAKYDAELKRTGEFSGMLSSALGGGQQPPTQPVAPNFQPPPMLPENPPAAPQQPGIAPQPPMQQRTDPFLSDMSGRQPGPQIPGLLGSLPPEQPTPNEVAREIAQVQAMAPQAGIFNAEQPGGGQAAPAMPPPAMPPMASSGGSGGGGGDDLVPVTLNGQTMMVPRRNVAKAYGHAVNGDTGKAMDALMEKEKYPSLVEEARYLYPNDSVKQNEHITQTRMNSPVQINLGEKAQELENKERIQRESEMLKLSREGAPAGRAGSKLAKENYQLSTKLMKRGFDPHRYDLTKQMNRAEIISILGGKATAQDISDFEVLNKNAIRLQLEMIKGLPARGLNQFQEKQIAQASGAGVTMPSTQRISVNHVHDMTEKQFADDFFTQYKAKYGTLDGALTAYHTWMDTMPEVKFNTKGGIGFEDDRKIERELSKWVVKPGTQEYNEARLDYLRKKDPRYATEEELEFLAEFGG